VTAINNVDTVITLVLPSIIIVISNVRISYALSLFYRSMQDGKHDDQQGNAVSQQQPQQQQHQHQQSHQRHVQRYQQQVTDPHIPTFTIRLSSV
jgi:ABC-type nickel/cobalt efflux system permease component RcnA